MSKKKIKAWIPVWAIIIASVFIAFEYGKVPPAAPNMMEVLGISYTTQGLMMTMFSLAAVVMALFGGALMDRFGARKVVGIALGLSVVGNIIGMFWTSDMGILVTRALEGCGYGATMTAGPGVIAMWYEPKKRGLANGVWGANVGFAMMIVTLSATPIMENGDWTSMWVFGLIGAILAFLLVVVFVKAPAESERKDLDEIAATAGDDGEKHGVLWGYLAPLSLLSAVMFFLVGGSTDAFNAFTIPFLSVENGWNEAAANLCATVASAGMLVGGTGMGVLLARVKDKGMLLFVDMLACAIGFFVWSNLSLGVVETCVIGFVIGCFLGAAPTVFFAMAPEVARSPKTVGAATAVVVLGQNGGTLAVPVIIGVVLDNAGYGAAAMSMGIISLVACAICLFAFRRLYMKDYARRNDQQ